MEQAQATVGENEAKRGSDAEAALPPSEAATMPLFIFRSSGGPDAGMERSPDRGRQTTATRSVPQTRQEAVLRWADAPAPDPESDDRLPPHGVARLRHLLAEYRTFPTEGPDPALCLHPNPQAVSALEQFSQRPRTAPATWEDLDRLELALLWVTPPEILRRQAPHVRARYQQAIGRDALLRYATAPSPPEGAESDGRLRADLEVLLSETQKQRTLSEAQARARSVLSRSSALWCLRLFGIGLAGFLAAQFLPLPLGLREALPLSLALLVGAIGGLVSLMDGPASVLSKGDSKGHSSGDRSAAGIIVGLSPVYPVKGAVFAALLYCLLAGGYGGSWPFGPHGVFLPDSAAIARLIVCAFLAGLTPRYVSLLAQTAPKWLSRQKPSGSAPTDMGG